MSSTFESLIGAVGEGDVGGAAKLLLSSPLSPTLLSSPLPTGHTYSLGELREGTLLHLAVLVRSLPLVALLLSAGASPTPPTRGVWTKGDTLLGGTPAELAASLAARGLPARELAAFMAGPWVASLGLLGRMGKEEEEEEEEEEEDVVAATHREIQARWVAEKLALEEERDEAEEAVRVLEAKVEVLEGEAEESYRAKVEEESAGRIALLQEKFRAYRDRMVAAHEEDVAGINAKWAQKMAAAKGKWEAEVRLQFAKREREFRDHLESVVARLRKEHGMQVELTRTEFEFFKAQSSALEEDREMWEKEKQVHLATLKRELQEQAASDVRAAREEMAEKMGVQAGRIAELEASLAAARDELGEAAVRLKVEVGKSRGLAKAVVQAKRVSAPPVPRTQTQAQPDAEAEVAKAEAEVAKAEAEAEAEAEVAKAEEEYAKQPVVRKTRKSSSLSQALDNPDNPEANDTASPNPTTQPETTPSNQPSPETSATPTPVQPLVMEGGSVAIALPPHLAAMLARALPVQPPSSPLLTTVKENLERVMTFGAGSTEFKDKRSTVYAVLSRLEAMYPVVTSVLAVPLRNSTLQRMRRMLQEAHALLTRARSKKVKDVMFEQVHSLIDDTLTSAMDDMVSLVCDDGSAGGASAGAAAAAVAAQLLAAPAPYAPGSYGSRIGSRSTSMYDSSMGGGGHSQGGEAKSSTVSNLDVMALPPSQQRQRPGGNPFATVSTGSSYNRSSALGPDVFASFNVPDDHPTSSDDDDDDNGDDDTGGSLEEGDDGVESREDDQGSPERRDNGPVGRLAIPKPKTRKGAATAAPSVANSYDQVAGSAPAVQHVPTMRHQQQSYDRSSRADSYLFRTTSGAYGEDSSGRGASTGGFFDGSATANELDEEDDEVFRLAEALARRRQDGFLSVGPAGAGQAPPPRAPKPVVKRKKKKKVGGGKKKKSVKKKGGVKRVPVDEDPFSAL